MRNCFRLFLIFCCLALAVPNGLCAQTGADGAYLLPVAINNVNAVFNKAIGRQSALYNGPQYLFYNPLQLRGSAYFQENTAAYGKVNYNGAAYEGIQLIYDLYKDELITLLYDGNTYFYLLKADVKNFDLLGHHFININADTIVNNSIIKSGYYDELYSGRTQVLVRITKTAQPNMSSTGTMEAFSSFAPATRDFFIRKNNVYYPIDSQAALLHVLKDRKAQLRKYINTSKIKFRKDPGLSLAAIAAWYDGLSN